MDWVKQKMLSHIRASFEYIQALIFESAVSFHSSDKLLYQMGYQRNAFQIRSVKQACVQSCAT